MATKADRKKALVKRLEALLESDSETLLAYASKLIHQDDVRPDCNVNPLVWVTRRIQQCLDEARR